MTGLWDRLVMLRSGAGEPQTEHVPDRLGRTSDSEPRRRVEVLGRVVRTSLRPTSGGAESFVGHLDSNLGTVELVWLGRRRLAGVEEGTVLRARGLLTLDRGRRTIYNPGYALEPVRSAAPGEERA